jgi:hypothetical protein
VNAARWTRRHTLRVMLFGPRPLALFDRIWLVTISMLVLSLIGLSIHQTHVIRDNGIHRACASYGADERVFSRILDRVSIDDPNIRSDMTQARDQKLALRRQLHCPPYPLPPSVPATRGG